MHFGSLEDDRKDYTEPHITFRSQQGSHRQCGLAICTFHLGFSLVTQQGRAQNNGLALLDYLYQMPVVTNGIVRDLFNVTPVTANNLTHRFRDLGILEEITNRPRNQVFLYRTYMDMLRRSTAV